MIRAAALALLLLGAVPATAQELGLSGEGPIEILADGQIEWHRNEQTVIASGNARAIRGATTVFADRLVARYRARNSEGRGGEAASGGATAQAAIGSGAGEIWRLEADGNVRIVSNTDRAVGDRAVYDLDRRVLVMTGRALSLTNGTDIVTARDAIEYWVDRRMAVARGAATVTSPDRSMTADTLVAHFLDAASAPAQAPAPRPAAQAQAPAAQGSAALAPGAGRLDRVEAFGDVRIRTAAEFVRGDRGIYTPETGIARVVGNVGITRGQNQLQGAAAEVNLKTGVSRLIASPGGRVAGLIVPEERERPAPAVLAPPPPPLGSRR
ncbi:LptA/OstA family protein [Elioraea sp.]|uniref:LptA/OstA family protein n=1 Tax=Elioraea sp. TaxID=2185103 RepID=UPI0025B8577B|nr:LptA/OstA family protein [Elioraea sp.]